MASSLSSATLGGATVAANAGPLGPRRYGVVVPIEPIGVHPQHLVDLDGPEAGAVQHARALATERLPLTAQARDRMARLVLSRLARDERARQQRVAGLQQALADCRARIEQVALEAESAHLGDGAAAQMPPFAGSGAPAEAAERTGTAAEPDATRPSAETMCSPRALRHEQLQASLRYPLRAEISGERLVLAVALALALLFTGMEVSLVIHLNPLLVPLADPTAGLSVLAQIAQALAALLLVTLLGGVRLLGTQASRADLALPQRLAAGALAAVTAATAVLLAAGLAWPAYKPLVEGLISGQSTASGMALEGSTVPVPLWLRLLTAPALLGLGVMAGQMADKAAQAVAQLRLLRPRLHELDAELALFQQARSLSADLVQALCQQLSSTELQQQVEQHCTEGYEAYLAGLRRHRQANVAPYRESAADRLLRQRNDQLLDALAHAAAHAFAQFDASPLARQTSKPPSATSVSTPASDAVSDVAVGAPFNATSYAAFDVAMAPPAFTSASATAGQMAVASATRTVKPPRTGRVSGTSPQPHIS